MPGARWGIVAIAAVVAILVAGPCYADKPAWAGHGKHSEKKSSHSAGAQFSDRERTVIQSYFGARARAGHCPPGLAKKNNGCMPPGQAKKWRRGRPLSRDVVFYDLPPKLSVELGPPPTGYRFVRVAQDILLIAAGTGVVLDAVEDIGKALDH